jgi:undecaprenyl-diphosphatase
MRTPWPRCRAAKRPISAAEPTSGRPAPPSAAAGSDGPAQQFSLGHTVLLGLVQGPAELLPISSSGHVALIPWLARWPEAELDGELRKALEVALHAGTVAALLIGLRAEVLDTLRTLDKDHAALLTLSFIVPALAGLAFERPIERRLGTPGSVAGALAAGSAVMALADRFGSTRRRRGHAGALDGLLLGLAQAAALIPGVSRNGATLAVARARGIDRIAANALSRQVALPVIVGAAGLKGRRLAARGVERRTGRALGAGAGAAFLSTLGSIWLIGQVERDRSPMPYAVYRLCLAAIVVRRLREDGRVSRHTGATVDSAGPGGPG